MTWKGSDNKGAGMVHELNTVEECQEVEQETRDYVLAHQVVGQPRMSRKQEATYGHACKCGYSRQCGGIGVKTTQQNHLEVT